MGMTMTQKILAKHAGLETVEAGQLVEGKLDEMYEVCEKASRLLEA